ncbi:hypothetical protein [Plantactinospora endophytica]|uniref:Uncharacterized protein n=1 Tax=Plantactinospora endophytica TaxID=673535 RepID=A0ABQ4DYX1_9ACTN|nr:hypothetical protein [Plantactinospora endophytica]GIG87618.1 hypothetical protein Pen02_25540 [Plantactinospora endophytica]
MTIDDVDVRGALRRATAHLGEPPGLLDDVRRGGRRRVVRRRGVLAAGLLVVGAASTGGVFRWAGGGGRVEVAAPLFDQPSRGDLAGNEVFVRRLLEVWRQAMADTDSGVRGAPHVVWAGGTPAGPAAFVMQRTAEHPVVASPGGARLAAVAAFVESVGNGLRVMTVEQVGEDGLDGNSQAALLGENRDVLLVLDVGRSVEFSGDLRFAADGRVVRTFVPVRFRDGAAVLAVPPQREKITVALFRRPGGRRDLVHLSNAWEILFVPRRHRPSPPLHEHVLPGAEAVWGGEPSEVVQRYVDEPDSLADFYDRWGTHTNDGSPLLTVYGVSPDGRLLLVTTVQYDDHPSRVIALLGPAGEPLRPVAGVVVDWSAVLPVRLRLPDGQGTVVAAEGAAFGYRVVGGGGWRDAGRDAALLPAAAVEVRVTPSTGPARTFPLR